jgi:hypothetical protein
MSPVRFSPTARSRRTKTTPSSARAIVELLELSDLGEVGDELQDELKGVGHCRETKYVASDRGCRVKKPGSRAAGPTVDRLRVS